MNVLVVSVHQSIKTKHAQSVFSAVEYIWSWEGRKLDYTLSLWLTCHLLCNREPCVSGEQRPRLLVRARTRTVSKFRLCIGSCGV